MKRFIVGCFCIVFAVSIFGQDSDVVHYDSVVSSEKVKKQSRKKLTRRYIPIGVGIAAQSSQDFAVSPLTYTGNSFYARLGHLSERPKTIHQFNISYASGSTFTRNYPDNDNYRQNHMRLDIDYSWLKRIKYFFDADMKVYIGPTLSTVGNMRINEKIINSSLTYELFTSLAASARFQKNLSLDFRKPQKVNRAFYRPKTIQFGYQISVPVVTLGLRPNYLALPDIADETYSFFELNNLAFSTFNSMWRINSLFETAYVMQNENMIKLGFVWDYYSYYKNYNDVKAALRGVYLSFVFNYN